MYFTQTYLGLVAGGARVYFYAITEGYRDDRQKHIQKEFLTRFREFGESTDERVAAVAPLPGSENVVFGEVVDTFDSRRQNQLKAELSGRTPGLLILPKPISEADSLKGAIYLPFDTARHPFRDSKQLFDLVRAEMASGPEPLWVQALRKLNRFLIVQPNVGGLGINFNQAVDDALAGRR